MNNSMQSMIGAVALLALFPLAHADKQSPPPAAPPKPFTLPAHQDFALDNGAKVTTIAYGTVPKASIALVLRGGKALETERQVWLADVLAQEMREGTKTKPSGALAEAAAEMGGDLDIWADRDQVVLTLDVLSEFAPRAIALVADVARNPAFPAANLERVKSDLLRRLAMAHTQPAALANEQFDGSIFPGHPYGRSFPTPAMLTGYTLEQVRDFYDKQIGAARAHLYVAGKFDAGAVEKSARESLGDWAHGADYTRVAPASAPEPSFRVVDRPGAVQSTLIVGLPTITPKSADYVALVVTDALLGGSFGSRITSNIREQKGYTYSPHSQLSTPESNATWAEHADVTTKDTGASLTEIFKEVGRLRAEPPSPAELHGIQAYLAGTFVLRNATRFGIIVQLIDLEKQELGDEYLRDYVQKIWSVKPADVQRIAQTYLDPKMMTIVVVGDRKVVDPQLKPWSRQTAAKR